MDESAIDAAVVRGTGALVTGLLGFVIGFLVFAFLSAVYLSGALLLGWGVSRVVPSLAGFPVLPTVMILTGTVLLILDMVYLLFRPGKIRMSVLSLYESAPADWNTKEVRANLTPRQAEAMMIASVRGMILGLMAVTLVFECLYAASISWGLQQINPEMALFAGKDAPGAWSHFIFWLGVPFDLFLLDAPSLFGFALSDLEPDRSAIAFLFGIFLFKTVLVTSVIRLVFELVRFRPPRTERVRSDT